MIGSKIGVNRSSHKPPKIIKLFSPSRRTRYFDLIVQHGQISEEGFPRSDPGSVEPFRSYRFSRQEYCGHGRIGHEKTAVVKERCGSVTTPFRCIVSAEGERCPGVAGVVHGTAPGVEGIQGQMPSLTLRRSRARSVTP